jgi:hypothetical protein
MESSSGKSDRLTAKSSTEQGEDNPKSSGVLKDTAQLGKVNEASEVPPPTARASGRSVNDFASADDLRQALSYVTLSEPKAGHGKADWLLPVSDPDANTQEIESEVERLWTLKSYLALDSEKEEAFDVLCDEARTIYGVPISAISLVDLGRQFAFASSGSSPTETPRNVAFCAHTILNKKNVMVVEDTLKDSRFRENKLVTNPPYLRFYAAAPLVSPEGYHVSSVNEIERTALAHNKVSSCEQCTLVAEMALTYSFFVGSWERFA